MPKLFYNIVIAILSGYGGIGRRVRLRGVWETVRVQVPITAPPRHTQKERTNYSIACVLFYAKIPIIGILSLVTLFAATGFIILCLILS